MSDVKIDSGVEIPVVVRKSWATETAQQMADGDSVGGLTVGRQMTLKNALSRLGYGTVCRCEDKEQKLYRVWRKGEVRKKTEPQIMPAPISSTPVVEDGSSPSAETLVPDTSSEHVTGSIDV